MLLFAETCETDYAELEKGTELFQGTPEAPQTAKSENAAHDIKVYLGSPYVTLECLHFVCLDTQ